MTQLTLFDQGRLASPATYLELAIVAREMGCPKMAALLEKSAALAKIVDRRAPKS